MKRAGWLTAVVAGAWLGLAALTAAELIPNVDCLDCHGQNDLTKTNQAGQTISLFVDEAKLQASVHRTNACHSCHSDLTRAHPDDNVAARPVACAACHEEQSASYGASVHGVAARRGDGSAAACVDCHGSHEIPPHSAPSSPLHFSRLAATCGGCHPEAAQDVAASVHGQGVAQGDRESATCTDCHHEHKIEALKGQSGLRVSEQVCGKCHASERINTKFRLPADRVRTFFESYHGLAAQYGSTRAANCASCHGYHRILPSSDPKSSIHPSHLVETCGKCHPGATENFALGKVHVNDVLDAGTGALVNRWVRRGYIGMIVVVIGFLTAHNLLTYGRKVLRYYRAADRSVLRMDRTQRVQHLILLASFILLAVTGFALKYPDSWMAWILGSDETVRRWLHRGAGVVLLGLGGYHLAYLVFAGAGRQLVRDLWLRRQDFRDLGQNLRYLTGRTPQRPKFGRFGYAEKFEYWAVVWGTVIMGVTGLMIWLKIDVTQYLPRWAVEVAITVHYYEAILACLAIVVWHLYHVILDPDVYPFNWAWWDGKVTEHWQKEEHPLDLPAKPAPPTGGEDPATPNPAGDPAARPGTRGSGPAVPGTPLSGER